MATPDRVRDLAALRKVWRGKHWTLYEVIGTPALVSGAELVSSTDADADADADAGVVVVVEVASPAMVEVRVRWSRWLTVDGPDGCIAPAMGGWTTIQAREPGRYTVTGSLGPSAAC